MSSDEKRFWKIEEKFSLFSRSFSFSLIHFTILFIIFFMNSRMKSEIFDELSGLELALEVGLFLFLGCGGLSRRGSEIELFLSREFFGKN